MSTSNIDKSLNWQDVLDLIKELRAKGPILQAIAIYDCEATKEHAHLLSYDVDIIQVALAFREDAGPIVRWFFKPKVTESLNWETPMSIGYEVAPINRYGQALVVSQRGFDLAGIKRDILGPSITYLRKGI